MSPSPNRARLTVALGGGWRLYQAACPPGMTMLGTISRGGDTGALAVVERTQQLVQLGAGGMRTLDQRKAWAALEEARGRGGRPAEMAGGRRVNVYLDSASLARAAELGGGNVSEGIRRALLTPPAPSRSPASMRPCSAPAR